jgi:hypothetical protein
MRGAMRNVTIWRFAERGMENGVLIPFATERMCYSGNGSLP